MKKTIIITLLFGSGIFNFVFLQNTNGKIYFFQYQTGTFLNFTLFMDGQVLCKLKTLQFTVQEIVAGEHTFSYQLGGDVISKEAEENSISINVETGKNYYVELYYVDNLFMNPFQLITEVPEGSFIRLTKNYKFKQVKKCL
ncbi:MAG: DUF2846 domain-containing protein [Bacteroidetes bacterium]|nr:DUF2846 domain-containing protein [Bacteroidota bacterium]